MKLYISVRDVGEKRNEELKKDGNICPGQKIKEQSTLTVSPIYNFSCLPLPQFSIPQGKVGILSRAPK